MSNATAPQPPSAKQQAYDRYRSAVTEGTRISLPNTVAVHDDFVKYIDSFRAVDPFSIDASHLGNDVSFAKEALYRTALTESFHTHYAQYDPKPKGPGNTQIVELRREADSGHHVFHLHGLTQASHTLRLETADFRLENDGLFFEEGVVKASLQLTSSHEVNGARVWKFQVSVLDRLYYAFYLVPFRVAA